MLTPQLITREIRHAHLFCGLGGGAQGFNRATPRAAGMTGRFRCLGGVDNDAAAIRDFARATGVPGTVLDLFDRQQYIEFHGAEPPASWREATPADKLVCRITAMDGTWHRPFTTLELAALQSLVDPEDSWVPWQFDGESDQAWRERIGNAVPPDAAQAIADAMGTTLLLAWAGETFQLSAAPVWVQPLAIALSVDTGRAVA